MKGELRMVQQIVELVVLVGVGIFLLFLIALVYRAIRVMKGGSR